MPFTDERCLLRALVDLHDDTDIVQFDFGTGYGMRMQIRTPTSHFMQLLPF